VFISAIAVPTAAENQANRLREAAIVLHEN
jgi:hypothetical protein